MSDVIAGFINDMLLEADGSAELRRAELANRFNCVPSQINYVISTRFSPERGYIVESRRGGGGYIRIRRISMEPKELIMHTVNTIGERIDANSAAALIANLLDGLAIDEHTARMIMAATCANALRPADAPEREAIRASIIKQMLINII
ncbi:MAG: CtsR family transcriptional regulator [Oscillospiraceae bacterium]|jgi:transcriptional regulator CtsR|nr:CtsR family transcriptional regulator [Oscillospiraceae bacterium]